MNTEQTKKTFITNAYDMHKYLLTTNVCIMKLTNLGIKLLTSALICMRKQQ